jgi:acetyl/propionyl-CoA carboxylase alpha subunit
MTLLKYHLKVGEQSSEMEVAGAGNHRDLRITMADKSFDVASQRLSEDCLWMVVNGKPAKAFVARAGEGILVFLAGCSYLVEDADRLALQPPRDAGHEETPKQVTPPMPSVVVRILVSEGAPVKKGQGLIVVAAMKMETTLAAPFDGKVKKINASLNQKVAPGDLLVEIEEEVSQDE